MTEDTTTAPTKQRRKQGSRKAFTDKTIKTLGEGALSDPGCQGLYHVVRNGSRTWMFRYKRDGAPHWLTLGRTADVSLAEARDRANANRAAVRRGVDLTKATPVGAARAGTTLRHDINDLYEHRHRLWDASYAADWKAVFNHLGKLLDKPTPMVTSSDLYEALKVLWVEKHSTADRILSQLAMVLDRAVTLDEDGKRFGKNYRSPVLVARQRLPQIKIEETRRAAMPWQQVPAFFATVMAEPRVAAKVIAFTLLTGTPRLAEVLGARWGEIDGDLWHVPAERMKSGKARTIPLVPEAVALLDTLRPVACDPQAYIFPGQSGNSAPISDFTVRDMKNQLGATGYDIHGFRSSFGDWAINQGAAGEPMDLLAVERCHDHSIGKMRGTEMAERYRRDDMLGPRRSLLTRWVAFLHSAQADIALAA